MPLNRRQAIAISGTAFYDWSDPRNPRPRKLTEYVISTAEDMTGTSSL